MRRFRLMSTVTLVVLGVLAIIAISPIGHVVAVLGAITVIGLPIAIIVVALPSLFLILAAVHLAIGTWGSLSRGQTMQALAFVVGLIAMSDYFIFRAWRVNGWLDGRAAAMVAGDKDETGQAGPIGTLAVLRNTRIAKDTANPCDDLCRRLLLTGAVQQVLALTSAPAMQPRQGKIKSKDNRVAAWPALEPAEGHSGTAWRLEPRDRCDDPGPLTDLRHVTVPEPRPAPGTRPAPTVRSEELMRLRIAAGTCLVGKAMALSQADALLAYGTLNSGVSAYRSGYDGWADTLSAWRIAFWRNEAGTFTEKARHTRVAWERLPGVFIPIIHLGAELRTENGWLRRTATFNRGRHDSEPPIGGFVTQRLGLDLQLKAGDSPSAGEPQTDLRAAQAAAVDRILAADVALTETEATIVADYISSVNSNFNQRTTGARDDDAARVLRLVQDRRIALPWPVTGAVKLAVQQAPSMAPSLARALVDRLDALPLLEQEERRRKTWLEQLKAITASLAQLPAAALEPHREKVIALMRDRERRIPASTLLERLDLFGPSLAPEIFAMMDDAMLLRSNRQLRHYQTWSQIWRAGAHSICRMASQLPASAEDLRSRAHALALQKERVADQFVATALQRMNQTEDEIRAALNVDPDDAKAMRSFESTMRRAHRDDACR